MALPITPSAFEEEIMDFHSEDSNQPKRALPHRQQAILQSQGQLEFDECLAAQRRAIPGVEQMRDALGEIRNCAGADARSVH